MHFDITVIGGGPAGLMAAIAAGENNKSVLLIDKGNKLGRKLAISGGGRCNVTNRLPIDDLIKNIPGNGRFLHSAFAIFNNEDIINFFERLNVPLKEEDNGRMFPVSDNSKTVIDALLRKLEALGVKIWTDCPVEEIIYEDNKVNSIRLKDGKTISTNCAIIAVGGKSVPQTGSAGDGYPWAEKAGHTITNLYPTEVPITSNEKFISEKLLQGLSLQNIKLSVLNERGKVIITHQLDMIFTHFGISGPAALRCSQFVVKQLNKGKKEVAMLLDCLPNVTQEQLFQQISKQLGNERNKAIKNCLKGLVPERLLIFLLEKSGINPDDQATTVSHEKLRLFINNCKQFKFKVNGTLSLEKAFVTGGGVSIKEIEPKTMQSKFMNGLFFCGEILDIHGYTGGFNITAALVTGKIAGTSAAQLINQ